jgi:hypothetical protein
MSGVRERCTCSSAREASILLNEVSIGEKRCGCAFSLLKKMFNILVIPDRSYSQRTLDLIMHACIILHNMIIDD